MVRLLLLTFALSSIAAAQGTTATQTIRLSVSVPTRLSAASPMLSMELRKAPGGIVGRVDDRMDIRGRSGRRMSAALTASMPYGSRLVLRIGGRAASEGRQVELTNADRPVDVTAILGAGGSHETSIEYRLHSTVDAPSLVAETRTIVYTMTD